jgi:hypothetical protein
MVSRGVVACEKRGLGKTALVQRFLGDLDEHGEAVALAGRRHKQESLPYKALGSLVDSLSRCHGIRRRGLVTA